MTWAWAWLLAMSPGAGEGAEVGSSIEPAAAVEPAAGVEPAAEGEPAAAVEPAPVALPASAPQPPRFLEPQRIPPRDRTPRGRTTSRFTDRPPLIRPVLRAAPGFSGRIGGPHRAAFGFDVLAAYMLGLHGGYRQWGLMPEVGYSLRVPRLEHRLLAGMGLVYGINAESWTVGWLPRMVWQPDPEARGIGVRNGLWFNFAENGFSVELSHQWLQQAGVARHELQITLGIDVAMLAFVIADLRMAWL